MLTVLSTEFAYTHQEANVTDDLACYVPCFVSVQFNAAGSIGLKHHVSIMPATMRIEPAIVIGDKFDQRR